MKYLILIFLLPFLAAAEDKRVYYPYDYSKPIWEQTDNLYCKAKAIIRCSLNELKCVEQKSNDVFTMNFKNGTVNSFGKNNSQKIRYKNFSLAQSQSITFPYHANIIKYGDNLIKFLKLNTERFSNFGEIDGIVTLAGNFEVNENTLYVCTTDIKQK